MHDDDDTKTPAPLTPEEEQAMRTLRPWYGLLRLFATLDQVRAERDALADVVATLRESAAELRRERDEARARVGLLRQRLLSSDLPMVGRLAMLAALGGGQ